MMRTQAQLTEEQAVRLKQIAHDQGVSVAELLRRGADLVIQSNGGVTWEERKRRALSVVGKYSDKDGATDVSVNHDRYLADAIDDWH